MRKLFMTAIAGLGIVAAAGSSPVLADEGSLAIGVSAGTLGLGPELAWRLNDHIGLRASGGYFDREAAKELDDIKYDAELKLSSFGAMLDLYPFGGGFRISAGGRINNNKIGLLATPVTNVEIGDVIYTPAEVGTLSATVTTDSFAPTLSLGYGGRLAKGFTFGIELGVMQQGSPRISTLTSEGGALSTNQTFIDELAMETQRAESDAHDFKLWPIIQIGLLYRF